MSARELYRRLLRDIYAPVARAVLNGDALETVREYQEAREPRRMRYVAQMRSGAEFNLITDDSLGFDPGVMESSLRELIAKVPAELLPSSTRH